MYTFRIKEVDFRGLFRDLENKKERAQRAFGETALQDMQPYVPMKSGALRGSGHTENGGKQIVWEVYASNGYPYGAKQFETQYMNYTTPGTGPHWDERATGIHMSHWENVTGSEYR